MPVTQEQIEARRQIADTMRKQIDEYEAGTALLSSELAAQKPMSYGEKWAEAHFPGRWEHPSVAAEVVSAYAAGRAEGIREMAEVARRIIANHAEWLPLETADEAAASIKRFAAELTATK